MKHYTDLVYKQLKVTSRRSFLTITGIIIGIMLFTAVGEIASFIQDVRIEEANIYEGHYEAAFINVSHEQIMLLKNNVKVKEYAVIAQDSYGRRLVEDIHKYIEVNAYDQVALYDIFKQTIELEEGRYPQNTNEVMLQSKSKNELNVRIGDPLINENKTYEIVGFYNKTWDESINCIEGITVYQDQKPYAIQEVYFNVIPAFKKIDNIINIAKAIKLDGAEEITGEENLNGNRHIYMNYDLLLAYGQTMPFKHFSGDYIFFITIVVYSVILIATITLTYSSLNASLKERVKQFGMLRCIGATPKQIRIIIIKESIILGVLGIIPGLLIGHFLAWIIVDMVLIRLLNIDFYQVPFQIDTDIMIQAAIFTVVTIFISGVVPIIKSGQITPIEGVKNRSKLVRQQIKVRKSRVIEKLFGYKGQLAYKNIRANRLDFIVSTVTLTLSLIIFIGFTGYCVVSLESIEMPHNMRVRDFEVRLDINSYDLGEYTEDDPLSLLNKGYSKMVELKEEILALNMTDEVLLSFTLPVPLILEDMVANSVLKDKYEFTMNEKNYVYVPVGYLYFYDDDTIISILRTLGIEDITLEQFKNNGAFLVNVHSEKPFKQHQFNLFDVETNEAFSFYVPTIKQTQMLQLSHLKSSLQTIVKNNAPYNFNFLGHIDMSEVAYDNRFGPLNKVSIMLSKDYFDLNQEQLFTLLNNVHMELEFDFNNRPGQKEELQYIKEKVSEIGAWYIDNDLEIREDKKFLSAISILVYTLLMLTTTIGIINILNNKMLQMTLRKKEFGTMLAIGMEKEALYKVLILEGVIQWLVASTIGGVISFICLKIGFIILNSAGEIVTNKVPIWVIPLGIILLFGVNLISIFYPLKRLKLMDTFEMIRDDE